MTHHSNEEQDGNVIIMSDAGKPIFWRHGKAEEILTMCGVIQAIRTSAASSELGEIQSLHKKNSVVVFMTVGAITLVSISKRKHSCEVLMKLQLEYLYDQILFTLTQQVQSVLLMNPNYDIGEALEASDTVMRGTLSDLDTTAGNVGPYLTGATDSIGPIPSGLRDAASMALLSVCQSTPNTVFAILMVREKLLSLVQPSYLPHQLHSSDLRLLLKFINSQEGLTSSAELWLPMCLPRFNSTGFLYAYSTCLHENTKLSLVLVSQMNSTDQFELFRNISTELRKELGLPVVIGSILQIVEQSDESEDPSEEKLDDVSWKRVDEPSSGGISSSEYTSSGDDVVEQVSYNPIHQEDADEYQRYPLLGAINDASDSEKLGVISAKFLNVGEVLHFVFRKDVQVRGHSSKECGMLPQCFSPPLEFPFLDENVKRRVWSFYQALCVRLRLGAASTEATLEGYHSFSQECGASADTNEEVTAHSNVAMELTECVPQSNCVTYVIDDTELFLAMNGRDFELYTIFPSSFPIKEATSCAAKLARILVAESASLFLMDPLTWKA